MSNSKPKRKAPFPTGIRPEPKMNTWQKHELNQKVVDGILSGKPKSLIMDIIHDNMPVKLSPTGQVNAYYYAQKWLEENVQMDAATIVSVHMIVYHELMDFFVEVDHVPGVNKCMKAIERLNGLHRETTVAKVNKKTNINVMQEVSYDTKNLLTSVEQARLDLLLNKAR